MTFYGIPFWVLALACTAIAALFLFVHPQVRGHGLRFLLQRWGHSLVWLLLAVACCLAPEHPGLARPFAAGGGLMYLAFLLATLTGAKG